MRFLFVCFLWVSTITHTIAAPVEPGSPVSELERLIGAAMAYSPAVRAAEQELAQARARHDGNYGFFDPRVVASTGVAGQVHGIPGVSESPATAGDAVSLEAGIERAFMPGFYAGIGAAQRYRWEALGDQDLHQSMIGAQIRVPLWRDRGFREYRLVDLQTLAVLLAAESRLVTVKQHLRHQVTLAYIDLQEAHALLVAADATTNRVQILTKEAEELVRLEVVPEYQLNQTYLEASLREEELLGAREALEQAELILQRLTGEPINQMVALPTERFIAWAEDSTLAPDAAPLAAFLRRGIWLELDHLLLAAEAGLDLAEEQKKPYLSLRASLAYQGESEHRMLGDRAMLADDEVGAALQLVFTQPLGFTRERARIREQSALIEELRERQMSVQLDIQTRLATTLIAYRSAQQRLALAARATSAAQATLEAEGERFRLGEGRSRQVLDAERDLTTTIRLQARNAARVLRAEADHAFEAGYPDASTPSTQDPDGDQGGQP